VTVSTKTDDAHDKGIQIEGSRASSFKTVITFMPEAKR
jgi:hypothetical protein